MRRYLPVVFALLVGGAVGFVVGRGQPKPAIVDPTSFDSIEIIRAEPSPGNRFYNRFSVYSARSGEHVVRSFEPGDETRYTININGGKITLFAIMAEEVR